MDFVGFTKKIKVLFYVFLLFLVLGLISFRIADSINYKYDMVRNNLINQINGKVLSNNDIKKIANSLQTINERFHTSESIVMYLKKDGIHNLQYFDLDFKDAEYLFPINTVKKDNFVTKGFRVTEGFDAGEYYIVHSYFPDWFFLIPIALFSVSGILFILWLIFQIINIYPTRPIKLKQN